MTTPSAPTGQTISSWAQDKGPVALHLKQKLISVEGEGGVIFPPTYANINYNIDTLSDGTKVALIDSVGSQANRMEPLFKDAPYAELVPQIDIGYGGAGDTISLLEVAHRLGDAVVRCSELGTQAQEAFAAFEKNGDATALAQLAPTSLVFGAWDSRDTQAKLPRIVQATIRAWDVNRLTRSAQFNPALDYSKLEVFSEKEKEKAEGKSGGLLAERGFVHVPSTEDPGGVVVGGAIERDVTVNLVALRRLEGTDSVALREYILGLSLVAATAPMDPFLRQGCILVPDTNAPAPWKVIERDGTSQEVALSEALTLKYATGAAKKFGVGKSQTVTFDKKLAKQDVIPKKK